MECHRGRARECRISHSELCRDRRRDPAVCTLIGTSFFGVGGYRIGIGIGVGLASAIVLYMLSLIDVFVVAYIIDFLAGTFGARKSPDNAMRVSAYAPTAAWVAGVFNIIPALSFLGILGLYSFYLLYTGITGLTRPPRQGGGLHDRSHRLRDRVGRYFRSRPPIVRRVAPVRARP
jgi:hypothetical protein